MWKMYMESRVFVMINIEGYEVWCGFEHYGGFDKRVALGLFNNNQMGGLLNWVWEEIINKFGSERGGRRRGLSRETLWLGFFLEGPRCIHGSTKLFFQKYGSFHPLLCMVWWICISWVRHNIWYTILNV